MTWNNTFYSDQNDETFLFLCAQSSHLDPFFRHSNEKIKKKGKRKRAGVPGDNNSSSSSFCVKSRRLDQKTTSSLLFAQKSRIGEN